MTLLKYKKPSPEVVASFCLSLDRQVANSPSAKAAVEFLQDAGVSRIFLYRYVQHVVEGIHAVCDAIYEAEQWVGKQPKYSTRKWVESVVDQLDYSFEVEVCVYTKKKNSEIKAALLTLAELTTTRYLNLGD